jgi:hypothetical protein
MFNKKIALALLALATGLAAASHAQAGQGTVMLGSTGFADRCHYNGGQLLETEDGYACELQTTLLECSFAGAYADCEWNGVQTKLEVVRLIGMVDAQSLSSEGFGAAKKAGGGGGGGGGIVPLDLPIKN